MIIHDITRLTVLLIFLFGEKYEAETTCSAHCAACDMWEEKNPVCVVPGGCDNGLIRVCCRRM